MLDEPTNHLDYSSIEWLEKILQQFTGTLVFVTHDRHFLNAVATRIIELDRGILSSYPGNYSVYQMRKSQMLATEASEHAQFDKKLAQEEIWIRKGIEARRTRNQGRVKRLEELRKTYSLRRTQQGNASLSIDSHSRSGHLVADLEKVSYSYDDVLIINQLSMRILRGDKLAIIGPNGAGKSTLLKLILGDLEPHSGRIQRGTRQQIAYFDQHREQLDLEANLLETVSPGSEWIITTNQRQHVVSYLNDFLFPTERLHSPVKSLSGGERNRLLLARLFAKPANILVLDEPTNDLDIETLELLESLLVDYQGTLFIVSHDRSFIDNVVTQSLVYKGSGEWQEYPGDFSSWQRMLPTMTKASPELKTSKQQKTTTKKIKYKSINYKEKQELDRLPDLIKTLEQEKSTILSCMGNPDLYNKNNQKTLIDYQLRLQEIETDLSQHITRWLELEEGFTQGSEE